MATATLTRAESVAFSLPRRDLLRALNQLATVQRTTSLPILSCLLIRAKGGRIALSFTDLDRLVDARLTASFEGEGRAAIPLKRLHDIVRLLPDADAEFHLKEKRVVVTSGRSRFEIAGMDPSEFPMVEVPKRSGALSLNGPALVRAIERVATHVATPETAGESAVLKGLLFELAAEGPRYLLGANRHRMARVGIDAKPIDKGFAGSFVVPREAVAVIGKLFGEASNVEVYGTKAKLAFDSGDVRYTVSLYNETFPPYSATADRWATQAHAEVPTKPLVDAVRRVATLSDHGTVDLAFHATEVAVTTESREIGAGEDVVPCTFAHDDGSAEPFAIRFNARYLIDGLEAVSAERTRFELASPRTSVRLRDAANQTNTAVAMASPLVIPPGA